MAIVQDNFRSNVFASTAPADRAFAITPDDNNNFEVLPRAIYVGGSGDIRVTTYGGDTITFVGHPIGYFLVRCRRVHATGTTATNLVGIY